MLRELLVENLGVIERAELTFEDGCSALTGETGAGKTLVVAALGLLLGDRAERSLVRGGADAARVEGLWVLRSDDPAVTVLRDAGVLEDDPDGAPMELVVSRLVPADGRGAKVRVNGRLCPVQVLAEAGAHLVEIAGQHQHQRLVSPRFQRALMDAYAGAIELADTVARLAREVATLTNELTELEESERTRRRDADVLRYEIDEIERLGLRPGEVRELKERATRLEHAAALSAGIGTAIEELGGDAGAEERLQLAASTLEGLIDKDPSLSELAGRARSAAIEVGDIGAELTARSRADDDDSIEEVRTRLDAIARLERKYGAGDDAILRYLASAQERLAALDAAEGSIEATRARLNDVTEDARARALELRDARVRAAPRLSQEVQTILASLALGGATFEVVLDDRDLYEGGIDHVSFRVALNAGETGGSISKVASGGELSRLALALHLLVASEGAATMVFDEVDAGVGGEAAQSIGRALAEVASAGKQVLVVTHLPQVAAFADAQYRVTKEALSGRTRAEVSRVEGPDRVDELSRMLAGMPESERAREHARELLELAGRGAR